MATTVSADHWRAAAEGVTFPRHALIDGELVEAVSGQTFEAVSPLSGKALTSVASCDAADVERAVESARKAFERADWATASPRHRKKVLLQFAALVEQQKSELALLITLDMGKPISDAVSEVESSAYCLQYYGEAVDKVYGEVGPSDR